MTNSGVSPFARTLASVLSHQRLSARQLATRAGLSHGAVSRLLAGHRAPSLDTAARIARALGVSLDALAGG